MTDNMCHHYVEGPDWSEEPEVEENETRPPFLSGDLEMDDSVDVELDREYDDRDVKTPGDD